MSKTQEKPEPPSSPAHPARSKERSAQLGRSAGTWLFRLLIVAPVIIGAIVIARFFEFKHLVADTNKMIVPTVEVVHPQAGPATKEIILPGDLTPFSEAWLYARTNGYLKTWYTDLGAKVKEGQVLAEIAAPDVDAQLNQATASLAQAQANQEIAHLNFQRQQDLLAKAVSSRQEFDQNRVNYEAASAAVKASQANVDNLAVQQNFQKIVAPFPGIVTERTVDVGDLVTAGASSGTSNSKALFHLARTDILRVFIEVPQVYSPFVSLGTPAYVQLAEYPGQKFEGHVTNIAGALDPTTRTMQTEVQVPNTDGKLFPGAYAQVHLVLPVAPAIIVPSNVLLFRGDGTEVGVVDDQGIVHLRKVTIGHDYGRTLEITEGLSATDNVIVNPSDSLSDGAHVQIAQSKNAEKN